MRALLIGFVFAAAIAAPAIAAGANKAPSEPSPGSSVEMPYLIAPLEDGDALVAYAYISTKIIASSPASAIDVRDKIPFVQDAFVRDVNTSSIGKPGAPQTVDNAALTARLFADVKKVMKPGSVVGVQLIEVQIRTMHPGSINPGGPS
jgi:hypothetical protein